MAGRLTWDMVGFTKRTLHVTPLVLLADADSTMLCLTRLHQDGGVPSPQMVVMLGTNQRRSTDLPAATQMVVQLRIALMRKSITSTRDTSLGT